MDKKELVESLKQVQKAYGWSQAKMAKEMGISRPLLSQIYIGKRTLQLKTLKGVMFRFPELKPQVIKTLEQI